MKLLTRPNNFLYSACRRSYLRDVLLTRVFTARINLTTGDVFLTLRSIRHPSPAQNIASARMLAMVAKTGAADFTSLQVRVSASLQIDMNSAGVLRIVDAKSTCSDEIRVLCVKYTTKLQHG